MASPQKLGKCFQHINRYIYSIHFSEVTHLKIGHRQDQCHRGCPGSPGSGGLRDHYPQSRGPLFWTQGGFWGVQVQNLGCAVPGLAALLHLCSQIDFCLGLQGQTSPGSIQLEAVGLLVGSFLSFVSVFLVL